MEEAAARAGADAEPRLRISLELTRRDVDVLLAALGELPAKDTYRIIEAVVDQCRAQLLCEEGEEAGTSLN
jgi:hypothetical protein